MPSLAHMRPILDRVDSEYYGQPPPLTFSLHFSLRVVGSRPVQLLTTIVLHRTTACSTASQIGCPNAQCLSGTASVTPSVMPLIRKPCKSSLSEQYSQPTCVLKRYMQKQLEVLRVGLLGVNYYAYWHQTKYAFLGSGVYFYCL